VLLARIVVAAAAKHATPDVRKRTATASGPETLPAHLLSAGSKCMHFKEKGKFEFTDVLRGQVTDASFSFTFLLLQRAPSRPRSPARLPGLAPKRDSFFFSP